MLKTVMITGANGGLGKETARQLAMSDTTEGIYLACRNRKKAEEAKQSLERSTGRSIFDVIVLDTSDLNSVRAAVDSLDQPVAGLVMNAGGIIGSDFAEKTPDGVTKMLAVNLLGHVVLLEELLAAQKLTNVAIFSSSETARGLARVGLKEPKMESYSVEEFASVCDGSFFKEEVNFMICYQYVKFMGGLYMSAMARNHTDLRLLTVSPGSTLGTDIYRNAPLSIRIRLKIITSLPIKSFKDRNFHSVEAGAKRYVDALFDEAYKSGAFYASRRSGVTGPMMDQSEFFRVLTNERYQDNARDALYSFIK
jgi:NAD(P)-dependent dehydrogenase (short-subunit alcohol dehydrogenase family)